MHDVAAWLRCLDASGAVGSALLGVIEHRSTEGQLWCPESVGRQLIDLVALRGRALVGVAQGAVRLVRLLDEINPGGYLPALYGLGEAYRGITSLRPRVFSAVVHRARADGCLDAAHFAIEPGRVICLEPTLATELHGARQPAFLPFSRMPLQAALLALLGGALGHRTVANHLMPLLATDGPGTPAYVVANGLVRDFTAWLKSNLDVTPALAQARVMRAYLLASGRHRVEDIDDDAILGLWCQQVEIETGGRDTGFRSFVTTARKMISFKEMSAIVERMREGDDPAKPDDGLSSEDGPSLATSDWDCVDETWESPLAELLRPPASDVRWLMKTEIRSLANYLGSPAGTAVESSRLALKTVSRDDDAAPIGLSARGAFDLTLWRTLLRADVFGQIQSQMVQAVRDGLDTRSTIARLRLACTDEPFTTQANRYRELRDLLQDEVLIVLDGLARAGDPNIIHLIGCTESAAANAALSSLARSVASDVGERSSIEFGGDDEREIGRRLGQVASAVASALDAAARQVGTKAAGPLTELMRDARLARARVRRKGLDLPLDPDRTRAFATAARKLPLLVAELDRLDGHLRKALAVDVGQREKDFFFDMFQRLYSAH